MPVADLRIIKNSRNGLPARYASIPWPVNVRDKKMTGIYELRNEVAINCKPVRRSRTSDRSLSSYLNSSGCWPKYRNWHTSVGTAAPSESLTEYAKYGLASRGILPSSAVRIQYLFLERTTGSDRWGSQRNLSRRTARCADARGRSHACQGRA